MNLTQQSIYYEISNMTKNLIIYKSIKVEQLFGYFD